MAISGGEIKYDFGGISQVVEEINGHIASLQSQKEELAANVKELLSVWDSTAATEYHNAQSRFDQAHLELKEVLHLISGNVQSGNDRMFETNARAAASWA